MSGSNNVPELKALILGGGESRRMGKDKSQLELYGLPQEKYLKFLCELLGIDTYISKRKGQVTESDKIIYDAFDEKGPIIAIASAFKFDPNSAWLVIACDLPLLNLTELQHLIEKRDPQKIATAMKSEQKDYPEPLICIWEPKANSFVSEHIARANFCPRKLLEAQIRTVKAVIPLEDKSLANANTPEELNQIMESMSLKGVN